MTSLKDQLHHEFEMKDLGELQYFLGMRVMRNRENRMLGIDQSTYIGSILARFKLEGCKGALMPMTQGVKLEKLGLDDVREDQVIYQREIGSLMYAMLATRPDIAFAVSQLSQFSSNPSNQHQRAAIHAFQYLQATKDYGITYCDAELILKGYSDADHGATDDRRSMSAYIFMLNGGAVSWMSKKQPTVALSSTEAEYIALTQAVKESIWIQRLLGELGRQVKDINVIHEDNQGAIALANNPEFHACMKHIDIQYHFVHENVQSSQIDLKYCPTKDMVADQLTKPLCAVRHRYLVTKMGVNPIHAMNKALQHHHTVPKAVAEWE